MDRLLGAPEALEFVKTQRVRRARGRVRRGVQLALSRRGHLRAVRWTASVAETGLGLW